MVMQCSLLTNNLNLQLMSKGFIQFDTDLLLPLVVSHNRAPSPKHFECAQL